MNLLIVTSCRADHGPLEWLIRTLKDDPFFGVSVLSMEGFVSDAALRETLHALIAARPDLMLVLGDRFEILGAVTAAHLQRVPIAHIAGGDVTEGSYDDAMRDCISRMASLHFVTSTSAMARLTSMGYRNVHLVGSPGIDYIVRADWRRDPPYAEPYVVVSYQAETIDGTNEIAKVIESLPDCLQVFIMPNQDRGNEAIRMAITKHAKRPKTIVHESLPHDEFLNLIAHCEEFVGNSSAMLYEAPQLKVKTRMIGKRQRGRTIPMGDGFASERMVKVLKYGAVT